MNYDDLKNLDDIVPFPNKASKEEYCAHSAKGWIGILRRTLDRIEGAIDKAQLVSAHDVESLDKGLQELKIVLPPITKPVCSNSGDVTFRLVPTEGKDPRSDLQKCVDAYIKECVHNRRLDPALLENQNSEVLQFDIRYEEDITETRIGVDGFTIGSELYEILEEGKGDFFESLRDYLESRHQSEFEIEQDDSDYFEVNDTRFEME